MARVAEGQGRVVRHDGLTAGGADLVSRAAPRQTMDSVLSRVAVSATLIAVGSLARNSGYVSRADGQALLRLIFSVTLPAVLLSIFATASLSAAPAVMLISLGQAVLLCCLALSWSPARTGREEAAVLVAASFGVNLGLFAVSRCEAACLRPRLTRPSVPLCRQPLWCSRPGHRGRL